MATSSIFTTVRITDPKMAEVVIDALDASASSDNQDSTYGAPNIHRLTDKEDILKLVRKGYPDL